MAPLSGIYCTSLPLCATHSLVLIPALEIDNLWINATCAELTLLMASKWKQPFIPVGLQQKWASTVGVLLHLIMATNLVFLGVYVSSTSDALFLLRVQFWTKGHIGYDNHIDAGLFVYSTTCYFDDNVMLHIYRHNKVYTINPGMFGDYVNAHAIFSRRSPHPDKRMLTIC